MRARPSARSSKNRRFVVPCRRADSGGTTTAGGSSWRTAVCGRQVHLAHGVDQEVCVFRGEDGYGLYDPFDEAGRGVRVFLCRSDRIYADVPRTLVVKGSGYSRRVCQPDAGARDELYGGNATSLHGPGILVLRKWGLFPGPFRARTEKNEGGDFPQHGERSSILQGMYVTIRQQRRSEKRELRERASSSEELRISNLTTRGRSRHLSQEVKRH